MCKSVKHISRIAGMEDEEPERAIPAQSCWLCYYAYCLPGSVLGGCAQAEPQKYSTSVFDVFDTVTTIIGYADSQEYLRSAWSARRGSSLCSDHQAFDGYNAYDGVHNLYDALRTPQAALCLPSRS